MINHATISSFNIAIHELSVVRKEERLRACIDQQQNYLLLKRSFDIVFSFIFILTVLSWMMPLMALLIRLGSKGPVLFRQKRIGLGGHSFTCYKFRTMFVNTDADLKQATENDERITRLGNFLRKSNIDEFPQFFNVLMGSMSIVGPRPHMYTDCYQFSLLQPGYKFRNMVRPGLTGLAQVKGYHGPSPTAQSVRLRYQCDQFYIRHISLRLDLEIIGWTVMQRLHALFQYAGWKLWHFIKAAHRLVEKEKLVLRAEKYRRKEDRGGIGYILRSVKEGDVVFDIGSHKGGYLHFLLQQAGRQGRVYAFEPQSILCDYLRKLKALFQWDNVIVESLAVSDRAEKATLYVPYNHGRPSSPGASLKTWVPKIRIQKKEKVSTITLDSYCKQLYNKPSFIKIDVEGNELAVFKGAVELLKTAKPKLLFECEERFVGEEQLKETFHFLEGLGYKGYFIFNSDLRPVSEFSPERFQRNGVYCNNFIFE